MDVVAYNSKVYYVITQGAGLGDNVRRFPVTGNEPVLDAISQINGLSQLSSTHIWIARPAPGNFNCEQIMPVDWVAITCRHFCRSGSKKVGARRTANGLRTAAAVIGLILALSTTIGGKSAGYCNDRLLPTSP